MHIQEALQSALDSAIGRQRQLYLLVDTAHAENSHLQLNRWEVPYASLFDGTAEASLIEIAPLMIGVNGLADDQQSRLFQWVQNMAYASPCLSWFETDVDLPKMAQHLRQFHLVGLSEGQTMLMRWYDTRILPVWFACLTTDQANAFAAASFNWHYVDRTGSMSALPFDQRANPLPEAPPFGQPLICLSDSQYSLLVDAADLDVLLNHLRRVIPDELKRVPNRQLTRFVASYQQKAIVAKLDDIDRQTQYVLLGLYTSGEGLLHPSFLAFMQNPPVTLNAFSDGLQALPDEVWNAGHPLWDMPTQSLEQIEAIHA